MKTRKCAAKTPICSGSLLAQYSVNGSEKERKYFWLCGACKVWLGRVHKLKLKK